MDIATDGVSLREGERLDEINENLRLICKKGALTFGTDAYLLSAFARAFPREDCADLGSGTGVISLLCASRGKYRRIFAAEIQEEFCDLIRRNAALNGLEERITVLDGDVRERTQADTGGALAAVIANPPYMAAGAGLTHADSRMETARRELNGTIYDFCAAASRLLKSGGLFYTVFRPDRMTDLSAALRAASLEPKRMVTVYPDTESRPCLILVESRRDGSPELIQSPPLIIYKSRTDRTYTAAMQRIYDTFSLEFLFERRKGSGL